VSAQNAEKNAPRQHPRGHQTAHSSEEMLFSSNESLSSPHRASETLNIRAARKFLSPCFRLFSHQKCVLHTREREKNTFCAKNVHLQNSTFLKDHPNATSFNLPHSPRRRRKTIYRRVSLLAWRVQPYSFCYAFARNFSFFLMRSE